MTDGERGVATVAVLAVVAGAALFAASVAFSSLGYLRLAARHREWVQALNAAEAGVDHYIAVLSRDQAFRGELQGAVDPDDPAAGTYSVSCEETGPGLLSLESVGSIGDVARTVKQVVRLRGVAPMNLSYAMLANAGNDAGQSLVFDKNVDVGVWGNVHCNGTAEFTKGTLVVEGDFTYSGELVLDPDKEEELVVSGALAQAPVALVNMRSAGWWLSRASAVLSGSQRLEGGDFDRQIVYVDGDLTVTGLFSGRFTLVCAGDVTVVPDLRVQEPGRDGLAIVCFGNVHIEKKGPARGGDVVGVYLVSSGDLEVDADVDIRGGAAFKVLSYKAGRDIRISWDPSFVSDPPPGCGGEPVSVERVRWEEIS
ncbi:MAG: hypothetical protein AB1609_22545 [Bacillota bacterium]